MNGRTRVAKNLRRIRIDRRISQEHLAVDAGVDRTYVGGIEREKINPTIDLLDRLAAALGVDISELILMPDLNQVSTPALKRGRKPKT